MINRHRRVSFYICDLMNFCKIETLEEMLRIEPLKLEGLIRDFIIHLRNDKKMAPGSVNCYIAPISHFYEMNDIEIRWKKIEKIQSQTQNCS